MVNTTFFDSNLRKRFLLRIIKTQFKSWLVVGVFLYVLGHKILVFWKFDFLEMLGSG